MEAGPDDTDVVLIGTVASHKAKGMGWKGFEPHIGYEAAEPTSILIQDRYQAVLHPQGLSL
jgi:hypothetical protein